MIQANKIEAKIIADLMLGLGRRPTAHEIHDYSNHLFNIHSQDKKMRLTLQTILRIGIKSLPLWPSSEGQMQLFCNIVQSRAKEEMPDLIRILSECNAMEVPLPLIFSCRKYLSKALRVAQELIPHYFGLEPVIIIGSPDAHAEVFDHGVLCMPLNDDYEGLPYKVFETLTFVQALGPNKGVIKIDDDVSVRSTAPINIDSMRKTFESADYIGNVMRHVHFDRSWHFGKCASAIAPLYGKPFVAPWVNGPLYYLSKRALSQLTSHYLRYPGILQGEFYEDKAVGDILYQLRIQAVHNPLQAILGIDTDAPERLVNTA